MLLCSTLNISVSLCCSLIEGPALVNIEKRTEMPYDALWMHSFASQLCTVSDIEPILWLIPYQSYAVIAGWHFFAILYGTAITVLSCRACRACMSARWPGWMASQTMCCALGTATAPACASPSATLVAATTLTMVRQAALPSRGMTSPCNAFKLLRPSKQCG